MRHTIRGEQRMPKSVVVSAITLVSVIGTGTQAATVGDTVGEYRTLNGAHKASTQLAASNGRLSGPEIRSLLSGRTARKTIQRARATVVLVLNFGAGGAFSHDCKVDLVSVRAQAQRNPQCRTPRASGNWSVRGNTLCIATGRQRCYFVVRRGGGYIFRPASGDGRPYGGRVSVR